MAIRIKEICLCVLLLILLSESHSQNPSTMTTSQDVTSGAAGVDNVEQTMNSFTTNWRNMETKIFVGETTSAFSDVEPAISTALMFANGVVTAGSTGSIPSIAGAWQWQPVEWSWWLILQMTTASIGIVGNLLVIVVLLQRSGNEARSCDVLIGALAAADCMTSIFMIPLPSAERVPSTILGEVYCKVVFTSMFMWVSVDASIMTLTIIPVERYLAIAYPLHFKRWVTRRKVNACIALIWMISFVAAIFLFFIGRVEPVTSRCVVIFPSYSTQLLVGVVLFFLQFLIPVFVTLIFQALSARVLHVQSQSFIMSAYSEQSNPTTFHLLAKKRVLQMLFLVVLIFIVCWGPVQLAYFAYNLRIISDTYLYSPLNRALAVLGFCNSCANPIIYTARYPQFRNAVKGIFTSANRTNAPLFDENESKGHSATFVKSEAVK